MTKAVKEPGPVEHDPRHAERRRRWWLGAMLAAAGGILIVAGTFKSIPISPPMSERDLVQAVTHGAVQRVADANAPGGFELQRLENPPSECPT